MIRIGTRVGDKMRLTVMTVLALAASLQACTPQQDIKAACEAEVREELLNPETAEFFDFEKVDAEAFKVAVIAPLEAKHNYPAGEVIVEGQRSQIDSAAHLYRMRVRAEGQLGNKITKLAFCRQPVEGVDACFCSLLD